MNINDLYLLSNNARISMTSDGVKKIIMEKFNPVQFSKGRKLSHLDNEVFKQDNI